MRARTKKIFLLATLGMCAWLLFPAITHADAAQDCVGRCGGGQYACVTGTVCNCQNTSVTVDGTTCYPVPTTSSSSIIEVSPDLFLGSGVKLPQDLLFNILRAVLGLIGAVAFVIVLYGGFVYLTAGGNAEQTGKALQIILWAAIGLAVILFAYIIMSYVVGVVAGGAALDAAPVTAATPETSEESCKSTCKNGGKAFYCFQPPTDVGGITESGCACEDIQKAGCQSVS